MEDICTGFIGFGLIGGSIAKAIKAHFPNYRLIAFNHHKNEKNESLELAKQDGIIDFISTDLKTDFKECDLVILCGPVLSNIAYLKQLKSIIRPSSIITDVGSVKGNIHSAVKELDLEKNFIGGHPMAGSEKTGYASSSARLLENAFYILTPTKQTPEDTVKKMVAFTKGISSIPIVLNPDEHDDVTAAISHVPHVISASLVNLVRTQDTEQEYMRNLAAGGFRDITRISSSSPEIWQNICSSNKDSILKFIQLFKDCLSDFEHAITLEDETKLTDLFQSAKEYRDSLPMRSKGSISKVYEVYLDLMDETGAIATVATILAANAISIQNIGIIHNREFEDGVLRIEFYDEESQNKAIALLRQYHYTVYER